MNKKSGKTRFRAFGLIVFMALFGVVPSAAWAIETIAKQAYLMDMATGEVLFEKDGEAPMPPASMSKMMTAYMLFERLRDGSLSLDDTFLVSEDSWRRGGAKSGGSTMFLEPGKKVRVEDLIRGIIIQSGNDACIVVAEGLASSELAFAEEMTARAKEIGLKNSVFKNATGWPDPEHRTTARDLAVLAKRTISDFPQFYPYYSEKEFTYNTIRQINRNPLLYRNINSDGLKTGHTVESGYGLTASATKGDRRLILVVNGLPTKKDRSREPDRLLSWGFREFNNYKLFSAGEEVTKADVWLGEEATVALVIENEMLLTLPRKARRKMKVSIKFENPVPAPIAKGQEIAKLVMTAPGREPVEVPLLAAAEVKRLGLMGRLGTALKAIVLGESGGKPE
ncbi:MAG: D-alanyl-D-alanine carboxypeptidase [Proteobacteria bacterium]|nr:D-alanyl-D-alanine carboxypeptidase [Pseudomonadota bacterium]MDA1023605.1 D-alanyl-D-alanine carboxypeptidase [Pseudomonadota bacterium]